MKEQIESLTNDATQADTRIAQSERNVAQMQLNIQQADRALFASLLVTFYSHNWLGILPPEIVDETIGQLQKLSQFAIPNPKEREAEWAEDLTFLSANLNTKRLKLDPGSPRLADHFFPSPLDPIRKTCVFITFPSDPPLTESGAFFRLEIHFQVLPPQPRGI